MALTLALPWGFDGAPLDARSIGLLLMPGLLAVLERRRARIGRNFP